MTDAQAVLLAATKLFLSYDEFYSRDMAVRDAIRMLNLAKDSLDE